MIRRLQLGALAVGLALTLAVALGFGVSFLRGQAATGTVAVFLTSRAGDHLAASAVEIHSAGGWTTLGNVGAVAVPAAPATVPAVRATLVAGVFDSIRLAGRVLIAPVTVVKGRVEPVLVQVEAGLPEQLYSGPDDFNLGLNEVGGKLRAVAPFSLVDQTGKLFDRSSLVGHETVLAAFHTTCHETCPLYTGLFLQLEKQLPPGVRLVEVTTDPLTDTPAALRDYSTRVGAGWTFLTGDEQALTEFWKPWGVNLSTVDSHASVLVVIDRHGYLRLARTGVPQVDGLPIALAAQLNPAGQAELGHGEGWGAAQVLDTVRGLNSLAARSLTGGNQAPTFTSTDLTGRRISLAEFRGRPLVLNFWATYCTPCRQELPLLKKAFESHPGADLLLVDERDSAAAARSFLASLGLQLRSAFDPGGEVGNAYGVQVLPTTVFIRADGTVEGRYLGQLDATTIAAHLAAIDPR